MGELNARKLNSHEYWVQGVISSIFFLGDNIVQGELNSGRIFFLGDWYKGGLEN